MRCVAIFHCWGDWNLLRHAVDNIRQCVEGIIIIGSTRSNYNEYFAIPSAWHNDELHVREPKFHIPMHSETDKRNYGIQIARAAGYTHFITMDADEFYIPEDFLKAKQRFHVEPDLEGLVCATQVYFGSPRLTTGLDVTLVPHIHKLTPTIKHEFNRRFPYAWNNGQIKIDPTRSLNINSGVKWDDVVMHHYSWVRDDYQRKIRNSTARSNLERSTILQDLLHAKEGYYCEFYRKSLVPATVDFGIHETGFAL
jgi:hypothetical protein